MWNSGLTLLPTSGLHSVVPLSSDLQNFWQEIIGYLNDLVLLLFFCICVMCHFPLALQQHFFLAFRVLTMICLLILHTPTLGAHWVSWFFHQTENFSAILLKNCSCLTFSRSFACGTPITRLLEHQILSHTSTGLRSFRFSNSFLLRIDKNSLALSPGFQAACCLRRLRSAGKPHWCTFISYAAFSRS